MLYIKYLIIGPIIGLCALIGILSGLVEHLTAYTGSRAYWLQCRVIDWAQTSRRQ